MDRFSALQLFVRVVDAGSFTQAARELDLGQPAVSKQIAALEARFGTPLLNRTSRGLAPTVAGQDLYESAVRVLSDLEDTESRIGRGSLSPAGLVRVATPPALVRMFVVPRLPAFFAQYPDVSVELSVSERHVDLVRDGIDVALRVGHLGDSSLVARRIGSLHTCTVATPAYLAAHGTPATPDDLRAHRLVMAHHQGATVPWHFQGDDGPISLIPAGAISSNNADDIRDAVLAGLGIGHSPLALFHADLAAGRLVRILGHAAPAPIPIHVVYASGRRVPRRVRVFTDFLTTLLASEPAFQPG
jgi:LysR family transcriptional regulator for bpeEF and oprC